jgi:hypothetical protein
MRGYRALAAHVILPGTMSVFPRETWLLTQKNKLGNAGYRVSLPDTYSPTGHAGQPSASGSTE